MIEVRTVINLVDFLRAGVLRQGVFGGRHDFFFDSWFCFTSRTPEAMA